jgi:hypothetical protein
VSQVIALLFCFDKKREIEERETFCILSNFEEGINSDIHLFVNEVLFGILVLVFHPT